MGGGSLVPIVTTPFPVFDRGLLVRAAATATAAATAEGGAAAGSSPLNVSTVSSVLLRGLKF